MEYVYKGLKGTLRKRTVTDELLNSQLEQLKERSSNYHAVQGRPARSGDRVILDFAGFCDGVQFEGGTAENESLILGSGTFIPGFEEQLVGANAGDTVMVHVRFPENYMAAHLAGKETEFRCLIHEIQEQKVYEMDDTFAKEVGGCETLAEMRERARASIQHQLDEQAELDLEGDLILLAAETCGVPPTEEQLSQAIDEQVRGVELNLKRQNMTMEEYCQASGLTMEQIRERLKPNAEHNLKVISAVGRIAGLEHLVPTPEDMEQEYRMLCARQHVTEEQLKEQMTAELQDAMARNITIRKVLRFVRDNAEVTVEEITE